MIGKTCSNCRVEKGVEDFYKKGKRRDSVCKICVNQRKAKKYKTKKMKMKMHKENRIEKVEFFKAKESCRLREISVLEAIIGRILFPIDKEVA